MSSSDEMTFAVKKQLKQLHMKKKISYTFNGIQMVHDLRDTGVMLYQLLELLHNCEGHFITSTPHLRLMYMCLLCINYLNLIM